MSIVRYDPFRDLRTLQEEVNRLFSTNLTRAFDDEGIGRGAWAPTLTNPRAGSARSWCKPRDSSRRAAG